MNKSILKNSDHCKLCDNMHFDFNKGVFCGLDMKRPKFNNKCINIYLDEAYKEKIKTINIEYESVLKTKTDTFGHIIIYSTIGVFILILNYVLTQYIFNKGFISTISIIIFVIALIPLGRAIGIFNFYRTALSIAKKKKMILDELTKLYNHSYDINIEHIVDSLKNVEHKVDLSIKKK
ncbi:hypothetical protein [Jejuia spongiicola]|uniref:DUF4231 domain-containing protein n=1 Tax=Jejuia spongiicola TaxID=2942207 RepID=A0ABT0QBK6_9FLAO|nr:MULTISPECIES: hypothetical protein [Flavobacteriaceae]MCL6294321.1 hypothetical protein [Jejuia spongiicola]